MIGRVALLPRRGRRLLTFAIRDPAPTALERPTAVVFLPDLCAPRQRTAFESSGVGEALRASGFTTWYVSPWLAKTATPECACLSSSSTACVHDAVWEGRRRRD